MIPLLHDFGGETVLVFGGGRVGARKARRFAAEADVVVVSPRFADTDFGDARLVRARPDEDAVRTWLDRTDPALVVAATDDGALNEAVDAAARSQGRLVNRADESGGRPAGSVVLPAVARDGPVVAGVGTGGASPALSAHLRDRIAEEVEGAGEMARLTAALRTILAERDLPAAERHTAIRAVVGDQAVWKALDSAGSNPRQRTADVISDVIDDIIDDLPRDALEVAVAEADAQTGDARPGDPR